VTMFPALRFSRRKRDAIQSPKGGYLKRKGHSRSRYQGGRRSKSDGEKRGKAITRYGKKEGSPGNVTVPAQNFLWPLRGRAHSYQTITLLSEEDLQRSGCGAFLTEPKVNKGGKAFGLKKKGVQSDRKGEGIEVGPFFQLAGREERGGNRW